MFAWTENYDVQETRRIAREEGLKEGRQKGIQEGKQEGIQEGRQEGIQEGRQEGIQIGEIRGLQKITGIAEKLLKMGMDIAQIIQVTGLSEEQLKKLNAQ